MKYESKFGIGEIVTTHQKEHDGRIIPDLIGDPEFDQERGGY